MENSYKYIEKSKYVEADTWNAAIGLQQVDGLVPSKYLLKLAQENVYKKLSLDEIENLLYEHYENTSDSSTKEADLVSKRIAELLSTDSFSLSPVTFKNLHEYLFKDILQEQYVGNFRDVNLSKEEPILNGNSVKYANYWDIKDLLDYDLATEKNFNYSNLSSKNMQKHFAEFTRNIWQTHPFREGNTRTTAVFMELYLNSKGFDINNDLFARKSLYFRNALVRANYADYKMGIFETTDYLQKFYDNLLFNGAHELTNKELICFDLFPNKEAYEELDYDDDIDIGDE